MSGIMKMFIGEDKTTPTKEISVSEEDNESNNVIASSIPPKTLKSKKKTNERLQRRRTFEGPYHNVQAYPINPSHQIYPSPQETGAYYNYPRYPIRTTNPNYPAYQPYNPYPQQQQQQQQQQQMIYTTPYPTQGAYYPHPPPYQPTQMPVPVPVPPVRTYPTSVQLQRERLESFHRQHEYQTPQVYLIRLSFIKYIFIILFILTYV